MTYYVMGVLAFYQRAFHSTDQVRPPFTTQDDDVTVDALTDEAKAAGLMKGDRVVGLDGEPYTGRSQWMKTLYGGGDALRPGDVFNVTTRRNNGPDRKAQIHLVARTSAKGSEIASAIVIEMLPPLICLFVAYWVVSARPRDRNAWLLLLLMGTTEVVFMAPYWWPGAWLLFLGTWYSIFQTLGPIALLLFGIYFPERSRFDVRHPFLKYLLIVPVLVEVPIFLWIGYLQSFHAAAYGDGMATLSHWTDKAINPVALVCVLAYWAAVIDKLRSATTADARRRMRVVSAGSLIGLGALLVVFVLLPHFFNDQDKLKPVRIAGGLLTMMFPLSLAYVVVVQRALDVRILVRMGTRYALARVTLAVLEAGVGLFIVFRFLVPIFKSKQDLGVAIPVTVLVVAGMAKLFASRNSVASRMQQWLDRKFFREAYNAEVVLSELSEQARGFTETGPLIETISRRISEVLHVREVGVFLRGAGGFQLQQAVGLRAGDAMVFGESSSTIRNLMRSKQPATLYREDPDGWFLLADEQERTALEQLGAELLLPLAGRNRLLGMMTLGPKRSEEAYSPTDLRLLQSVSTQTGLALEISELIHSLARQATERERIDREMEIAREVQERLFPQQLPVFSGLTLAGGCRPAQGIGGDYYDLIELDNGLLGIAIGDISGKGISAALLMASLRASLRGVTMDGLKDLAEVMQKVNRLVYEASATNRYATFFFAVYNPSTSVMRYVNAGHNSPIILRQSAPLLLDGGGPVVGLLEAATYEEQQIQLQAGDLFLGYTDGISEAMTRADEEWGEERMVASASQLHDSDANEVLRSIFAAADAFTKGAPQHDDMTLLLMKLHDHSDAAAVA